MRSSEIIKSREALELYDIKQLEAFKELKASVIADIDSLYFEKRHLQQTIDEIKFDQEELKRAKKLAAEARNQANYAVIGMFFCFCFAIAMTFLAVFAS